MSESVRWTSGQPGRQEPRGTEAANLADILERVLDKGIVIAGDIQVNLLDIELLTIKIRLVVASVDRAKEMGIDWWERDPTLSAGRQELEDENDELRSRIAALEAAMDGGTAALPGGDDRSEGEDADEGDETDLDEDDLDGQDGQDGEPAAEPGGREPGPEDEPVADGPSRTRTGARPARRRAAGPADRAGARRGRSRDR